MENSNVFSDKTLSNLVTVETVITKKEAQANFKYFTTKYLLKLSISHRQ